MKHPTRQNPPPLKAKATGVPTPAITGVADPMLTRQEIARQLRISTCTVDEWRQDKVIPCIKVGKVVLFYWPDVVSALREKYSVASAKAEIAKAETLKLGLRDHRTRGSEPRRHEGHEDDFQTR